MYVCDHVSECMHLRVCARMCERCAGVWVYVCVGVMVCAFVCVYNALRFISQDSKHDNE